MPTRGISQTPGRDGIPIFPGSRLKVQLTKRQPTTTALIIGRPRAAALMSWLCRFVL